VKETGAEKKEKVPGPGIASNVENCSNFLPSNWGSHKKETTMAKKWRKWQQEKIKEGRNGVGIKQNPGQKIN